MSLPSLLSPQELGVSVVDTWPHLMRSVLFFLETLPEKARGSPIMYTRHNLHCLRHAEVKAGARACSVDFIQYAPSHPNSHPVHVPCAVPTWRPSGVWITPGCSEKTSMLPPFSLQMRGTHHGQRLPKSRAWGTICMVGRLLGAQLRTLCFMGHV